MIADSSVSKMSDRVENVLYNLTSTEKSCCFTALITNVLCTFTLVKTGDTSFYWQMIITERFNCETDKLKGYWCGHIVKILSPNLYKYLNLS